ncbi:hypothetical protein MMC16_001902 [Acarospora aff. strigata]|nr:hypothetical protein [Acarospora aff. strigata]
MCRVLGLVIHAFWQALLVAQSDAEAGEVVVAADAALQCDALVDQVEGVSVHLGPTGLDDSLAKYTVATAILTLHHNFPTLPAGSPTAAVDVNLLLSTLKSTDTQVGEWVNILGYVTSPPIYNSRTDRKPSSKASKRATVFVQAVMLWSAGSIHLGEYERTLKERKDVEKRMWLSL